MKRVVIVAVIGLLMIWPGAPLMRFYGPFVVAWFVSDGGRP